MPAPRPEGWYRDPYGRHEARWFSDGTATALVRDGDDESHDPPPSQPDPSSITPEELPVGNTGPNDLMRADEPAASSGCEAAMDAVAEFSPAD